MDLLSEADVQASPALRGGRGIDTAGLVSAVLVGIVGALVIFVTPGFLALVADQARLDDTHLGYIAACDINAMAATIGVSAFLLTRCNWRAAVGIGLLLIAAGNVATAFAGSFGLIAAARVIAGAGEGIAIGFSFAALGRASNPDRAFSIYLVAGALFSSVLLYGLPLLQQSFSPRALFCANAVFALLAIACLPGFVEGRATEDDPFAGDGRIDWRLALPALVGVFLYFFATGAVWSYAERIGAAHGLDAPAIARGLSLGTLAGVAGAALAGMLPRAGGRRLPLIVSGVISVASFQLLLGSTGGNMFAAAAILLLFGWNFAQPLLSGICADADDKGRVVCAMGSIQTFGMGLGPAAAGAVLGAGGFALPIWSSCAILAVSLLIVIRMKQHAA